jgi:uncharacterized protein (DUF983 family)
MDRAIVKEPVAMPSVHVSSLSMSSVRKPVNQKHASLARALWRGFSMRCPNCGGGGLFGRFLKVADHCPACGEEFFHHRADDFPAYLVIVAIGHIVVPGILIVEELFAPPVWLQLSVWLPVIAGGALALLQPTKGAVVALQWHVGMHGFEQAKMRRDAALRADARPLALGGNDAGDGAF